MMQAMIPVVEIEDVFADLPGIPQDDGPDPVCSIQYPTAFVIAYDRIRAVWKKGEKSERALKLSATCLKLNPANYTVWHFRRECLQALGLTKEIIQQDLQLAASLGGDNPKNYQIWYHRRALLEMHDANMQQDVWESELDYIAEVLREDSKNYHAWSHRQWILKTANEEAAWNTEVDFAHKMIQDDPRNNSAWNQRWFAVHRAVKEPLTLELCRHEADYAIHTGATLDPFNESPWRYLIGLLREQSSCDHSDLLYSEYYTKTESLRSVLADAHRDPETCANWTSARIDLLEGMGDKESLLDKAIPLAEGLAREYDPIRKKYWMMRVDQMKEKAAAAL